jgi:hypothetical protein
MNYQQLYVALQDYTQNFEPNFVANIPTFIRQAERRIYNTVQLSYLRKNQVGVLTADNKYLSAPADFLSVYSISVVDTLGNYHYLITKDVNYIREVYPEPAVKGLPKYYAIFGPTISSSQLTNDLSFILGPTPDAAYTIELHYYFYPPSIVAGVITALGAVTGGSGYTNGVYYNVPLDGGAGVGATATIVVSLGEVTSCTIESPGSLYRVGDELTASQMYIGGGTLFSVGVTAINNSTGTSWLGDNYDVSLLYGSLVEAYGYMKGEADMMNYYNNKYMDALAQLKRLGDGLERGDAYRDGQAKIKVE